MITAGIYTCICYLRHNLWRKCTLSTFISEFIIVVILISLFLF